MIKFYIHSAFIVALLTSCHNAHAYNPHYNKVQGILAIFKSPESAQNGNGFPRFKRQLIENNQAQVATILPHFSEDELSVVMQSLNGPPAQPRIWQPFSVKACQPQRPILEFSIYEPRGSSSFRPTQCPEITVALPSITIRQSYHRLKLIREGTSYIAVEYIDFGSIFPEDSVYGASSAIAYAIEHYDHRLKGEVTEERRFNPTISIQEIRTTRSFREFETINAEPTKEFSPFSQNIIYPVLQAQELSSPLISAQTASPAEKELPPSTSNLEDEGNKDGAETPLIIFIDEEDDEIEPLVSEIDPETGKTRLFYGF